MSASVFLAAGDGRFVATEHGRGPWDPGALHGGAPAALLMRAFERMPVVEGLTIARATYEFVRPVPVGELVVEASVARSGRRVRLLEGTISTPEGVEVVRARALEVRTAVPEAVQAAADADSATARGAGPDAPLAGPAQAVPTELSVPYRPMFSPDAIEIRFASGTFPDGRRACAWFRLRVPLVAGEDPSPLQQLAAAGDFGNGISSPLSWADFVFINPDLTLYIERPPAGEWVCLESRTRIAEGGIGVSESVLYDEHGRVGRAMQALFVARR